MIKGTAILLVGLLAAAVLRRRSASLRHWVLASAIASAALVPLLTPVLPRWEIPVRLPWDLEARGATDAAAPASVMLAETGTALAADANQPPRLSLGYWLRPIWLVGVATSLGLLLVGLGRMAWLARRSNVIVDGPWADTLAALSRERHQRRTVRLLQSARPTFPVTWGCVRPTIILPAEAREWPANRIRAVLGHELAHVERGDWAVQTAAGLVRCFYWFNPLAWIVCDSLRQESERACDDVVLGTGLGATDYATHLLEVARAARHARVDGSLFPAPAMVRRSHLEGRVRAMLQTGVDRRPLTRRAGIGVLSGLLGLAVPVACLVASSTPPEPSPAYASVASIGQPASISSPAPAVSRETESTAAPKRDEAERPVEASLASKQTRSQGSESSFSGVLMDATGRSIPGVPIVLVHASTSERRELLSDAEGRFEFGELPAGEYRVEVQKPGFMRLVARVVLADGQHLRRELVAQIGSIAEVVVVTAKAGSAGAGAVVPRRIAAMPDAPEADPCAQSPVGGCITPPRKLVDARPVYPRTHAESGVSGKVEIEGSVGTDGFVKNLRVGEGADAEFATVALEAIRLWQYTPVRLNGVPQECRIVVTVQYHLSRE